MADYKRGFMCKSHTSQELEDNMTRWC